MLAQSAAIAHEVDWPWWELFQLSNLADSERRLGLFAEAEGHASRALRLALGLGDRMSSVFAGAELASAAAARGDSTLAGRLWGAIESEEAIAPIGQWTRERETYESLVRTAGGPDFERARQEGTLLSLAEAAGQT